MIYDSEYYWGTSTDNNSITLDGWFGDNSWDTAWY
jgi:hypothetical protein